MATCINCEEDTYDLTVRSCASVRRSSSSATGEAILFDRHHRYCYLVGPVLLTGTGIFSASVSYSRTQSQWSVNLNWSNNDFLRKVVVPNVNKAVAVVLNGVVQSAPVMEPGITGRDVEIVNFSRSEAINIVASIMAIAPSQMHIDSNG